MQCFECALSSDRSLSTTVSVEPVKAKMTNVMAKPASLGASLPFSNLIFAFISKYPTEAAELKPELVRVCEQLTSFMKKAALAALKNL